MTVIKVRQSVGRTLHPNLLGNEVVWLVVSQGPLPQWHKQANNSPHIVSWSTIGLIHRLVDTLTDRYTDVHSLSGSYGWIVVCPVVLHWFIPTIPISGANRG